MLATQGKLRWRTTGLWAGVLVFAIAALAARPEAGPTQNVTISGMQFAPAMIHIKAGDTVVWTNTDDRDHTVIAVDGSFSSGNLPSGQTFEHQFNTAGSFAYFCKYHPRMKGTIVVAGK